MGESTKVSGRVLTASTLCVVVGIALALTGCTNDVRATGSPDITTLDVETQAEPQVECSSGWRDFGPARPGTAETMVPDAPLFAEVCRYEKAARGDGPPTPPPLTASGRIDGAELATVVDAFNAATGEVNPRRCGRPPQVGDPATIVWTTFHYAEGLPVQVAWSGPCNQIGNGTKSADNLPRQIPPYWTNPEPG
ncbi:hypothetical protein [Prescottella agglutinans]|uniref:Uncharacterized protein n=1 Tax=Prescottella agglutinans TaxID=1644129 RepID=A0ABT6MIZ6_9NOCA|nr:hypothetical protein [Prescottella agglutinans]MDH6284296.1 hypothetical protein [Prescottella agglutinans]